ncbi:hypothetical protein ACIPY5_10055 [Microbacterium sp. NPDC089698]|uniref:hypothetical protein n=1 Tax=Microbacterium sp. NPDC089698 TaxID=3364200 RepID=UPI00382355D8
MDVQSRLSASLVGHRDAPLVLCAIVLLLHGRGCEGGDDALGEGLRARAGLRGRVGDDGRLVGGSHGIVLGGEVARGLDDYVGVRQRERAGGEGFTRAAEALVQGVRIAELLRRGVGGDPKPCGELADHGSFGLLEPVLPRSDLIEEQPHPFGESLCLPGMQPGDLTVDLRALLDQRRTAAERVVGGDLHASSLERSTDIRGPESGSGDYQYRTCIRRSRGGVSASRHSMRCCVRSFERTRSCLMRPVRRPERAWSLPHRPHSFGTCLSESWLPHFRT